MAETEGTQNEDATDRVEDLTDTWESSPLTEPERASDPAAKSPSDHGNSAADAQDAGSELG